MTTIISGNWKMNGSRAMIDQWFEDFSKSAIEFEANNKIDKENLPVILICVPDIYIEYAIKKADEYNKKMKFFKVLIGAEDVHFEEKGAFTGSTSPAFLKEISCKYTLVGHSERRQYQHETDEMVAKKAKAAIDFGITPIICAGEELSVREVGKHLEAVGDYFVKSTEGVDIEKSILAYEPVWAIGTGKVPTNDDINEMEGYIKDVVSKARKIDRNKILVTYGGSVKASNAKEMIHLENANGVLVGGASMKGEEFFGIVKGTF